MEHETTPISKDGVCFPFPFLYQAEIFSVKNQFLTQQKGVFYEFGWWEHPLLEWEMETTEYGWESGHLRIVLDLKLLFPKMIHHQKKFASGNGHCRSAWGWGKPPNLHVVRFCSPSCLHPTLSLLSWFLY